MRRLKELSIFFPFWNEEENIERVVSAAIPVAENISETWEIIMVDDGSTDNTAKIARKLAEKDKRLRLISYSPNRGYGSALKEGFKNSKYEIIVFNDGDGQFDFSEVTRFIDKIDSCDIVIGFRKKRRDNLKRHVLMNLLKVWDFVFFGFYFSDIDCGFKMFKKEAVEELLPLRSEGAMITTEILAKSKIKKLKMREVEVTHYPRKFGAETGGNMYVVVRAILESIILWWDLRNGRF
jgi:glycosyltransferase involved in cell wall biosynthesis